MNNGTKLERIYIRAVIDIGATKLGTAVRYYTNDGHALSIREEKFINHYIQTQNSIESATVAGYNGKDVKRRGIAILAKPYIRDEIEYRQNKIRDEAIMSTHEQLAFYTKVARGEIKDAFGLDAPLDVRLKAAEALSKRTLDVDLKREAAMNQPKTEVYLHFDRPMQVVDTVDAVQVEANSETMEVDNGDTT